MPMNYTMQNPYEPMCSEITSDHNLLDGETAGYTLDFNDKPSYSFKLRPDSNISEMIFSCNDGSVNKTVSGYLWAYAQNGCAEKLADASFYVGTARINDSTTSLWFDTIVTKDEFHITPIIEKDMSANRIGKYTIDSLGYTWLVWQFHDLTIGQSIRPWIRTF
jgi:hypothetical protein